MSQRTIIVADDDGSIRTVLGQALARAGYDVRSVATAAALWRSVASGEGDLVVTDVVLPDNNVFDLMPRLKNLRPRLPIIVMSAQNTFMTAIRASELGAYDYLPKPFELSELVSTIGRALADTAGNAESMSAMREGETEAMPLVGRSAAMQEVFRTLARLMPTELTVLVLGESGTGKELVARALHDFGKRRKGPFIAVNMAAIPRELIESELFGHEKGAFTGAVNRQSGRFEQAAGGTLFLDEIGDMPLEAQTRLLRVLQQGEFMAVGGRSPIRADVRIVAATHKDLRALIKQGLFREDLFYRLNVVPIRLPPLRERREDIPALVNHFLAEAEKEGLPRKYIGEGVADLLSRQEWPGNVRELANLVLRLAALCPDEVIVESVVAAELERDRARDLTKPAGPTADSSASLMTMTETYLNHYFSKFGESLPPAGLYDRILREVEPPLINAALAACKGNQVRAADLLGLNRNTLRKKIRDLGLELPRRTV